MKWLALVIAGPAIWGIGFALVYALHGIGCNLGWVRIDILSVASLHYFVLWAGWLLTVSANLALVLAARNTAGIGLERWLPRTGAWIGLGATLFSLLPVALSTSC